VVEVDRLQQQTRSTIADTFVRSRIPAQERSGLDTDAEHNFAAIDGPYLGRCFQLGVRLLYGPERISQ
jgi:hypothetical protein